MDPYILFFIFLLQNEKATQVGRHVCIAREQQATKYFMNV